MKVCCDICGRETSINDGHLNQSAFCPHCRGNTMLEHKDRPQRSLLILSHEIKEEDYSEDSGPDINWRENGKSQRTISASDMAGKEMTLRVVRFRSTENNASNPKFLDKGTIEKLIRNALYCGNMVSELRKIRSKLQDCLPQAISILEEIRATANRRRTEETDPYEIDQAIWDSYQAGRLIKFFTGLTDLTSQPFTLEQLKAMNALP
jgi:hypothetical protein